MVGYQGGGKRSTRHAGAANVEPPLEADDLTIALKPPDFLVLAFELGIERL